MANSIVQNDNGVVLYFNVTDADGNTGILNNVSSVECKIVNDGVSYTKTCTIVDETKCYVTLASADIATAGKYTFQLTITYLNGNIYSSVISKFSVSAKL